MRSPSLASSRSLTAEPGIRPTAGFEDRVMAAIATEPAPRLVIRPGSAVRGGRAGALLLAIRDSWGIATTGGRPMAMRAQALAFVFLAVVAVGALTGVGAMTVGSLLGRGPVPSPTIAPGPTIEPTASPSGRPVGEPVTERPRAVDQPGPERLPGTRRDGESDGDDAAGSDGTARGDAQADRDAQARRNAAADANPAADRDAQARRDARGNG